MPNYTSETDAIIHVVSLVADHRIGHASKYVEELHRGTDKSIEGWNWDKRLWPDEVELKATSYVPNVWDSSISGLDETFFQSGYGDGDDLLLMSVDFYYPSGHEKWIPKVHHGYFYIYDEEWYLYSDTYQAELLTSGEMAAVSGHQFSHDYKPTIPQKLRRYEYDRAFGRYRVDTEVEKVVEFTNSGSSAEFLLSGVDPTLLWLNADWNLEVGTEIILVSGLAVTPNDVANVLEQFGEGDGTADQVFHLQYSPVMRDMPLEIWSYSDASTPYLWSEVAEFTTSGREFKVDHELGLLTFGDYDLDTLSGLGLKPESGERMAARYYPGFEALYEPEKTPDHILGTTANVNPVRSTAGKGFVQVTTTSATPDEITLSIENLTADLNGEYSIEVGNNVARLAATVLNEAGDEIEGLEVTFQMLDPPAGSFGTTGVGTGITDYEGIARSLWSAPVTIDDVGKATEDVSGVSTQTWMDVEGLLVPTSVSSVYLYKVHYYDLGLGIASSGVDEYYTSYLAEETITSGTTADIEWEKEHRSRFSLGVPLTYEEDSTQTELKKGRMTAVVTDGRTDVVDPTTGDFSTSAFAPLYPAEVTNIGTTSDPILQLKYDTLLDLPGSGLSQGGDPLLLRDISKAYFVVGDSQVKFQASVVNPVTNKTILSNIVTLFITIPDAVNGTYYADVLSDAPSGLLTKVRNVDLLSDATIETSSGLFWDEYQGERELFTNRAICRIRHKSSLSRSLNVTVTDSSDNPLGGVVGVSSTSVYQTTEFDLDYEKVKDLTFAALKFKISTSGTGDFRVTWVELQVGDTYLRPDATLFNLNFSGTPSANLYENVDDVTPDDDTSYIYNSDIVNAIDFELSDGGQLLTESYVDWFRRTRRGDTLGMSLTTFPMETVDIASGILASGGEIPLGFRVKSSGITLASALGQVTYYDVNDHLPSGYWPSGLDEW